MRGASQAKGRGQHLEEVESGDAEQFLGAVMGEGVGTELVAIGLSSARPAAELQVTRVRQGLNYWLAQCSVECRYQAEL